MNATAAPAALIARAAWTELLTTLKPRLEAAVLAGEESITITWAEANRHAEGFADALLDHPREMLHSAEDALGEQSLGTEQEKWGKHRLDVRVRGLPEISRVPIRKLRAHHVGRFLAIEGLVKQSTKVQPRTRIAAWRCLVCNARVDEPLFDPDFIEEPLWCAEGKGGCQKKGGGFLLLEDQCRDVNFQRLEVQEAPDALRGGEQPQRLTLWLEGDLCGVVRAGDRLTANGMLRKIRKRKGGRLSSTADTVLEVNSLEPREAEYDDVPISPDEEWAIREAAADPNVYDNLAASIAPSLYGLKSIKLTCGFQLFGGVERHEPDGTRRRGDIHVLLVGDPGVAKSVLLRSVVLLSPRGQYASGRGSSGVGLTASMRRDGDTDQYVLEAGAMVLADRGLCCIDEIEKMQDEDRDTIHVAMEQGFVPIHKAGVNTELNSRCCILAAANPKDSRFNPDADLAEQIDLGDAILSRFDVIWVLLDLPDRKTDLATALHILAEQRPKVPYDPAFLRKYVAYAKRTCSPGMSPEATQAIAAQYVDLRQQGAEAGVTQATPRQNEAIKRLAQASARIRLSDVVMVQDVDRAIELMQEALDGSARRADGRIDIDKIHAGMSQGRRDRLHALEEIIKELDQGDGAHVDDVVARAKARGIPEPSVLELLGHLRHRGDIYNPAGKPDCYRRV